MFIQHVDYPFKSIIDDSHATLLANKYQHALVSFLTQKENSKCEFILVSTGFLI